PLARAEVHGAERLHEGREWLHGHPHDNGCTGRHAALEPARIVSVATEAAARDLGVGALDLVMDLRAAAPGGLEAETDLHPLHRLDRQHRLRDAPVEPA